MGKHHGNDQHDCIGRRNFLKAGALATVAISTTGIGASAAYAAVDKYAPPANSALPPRLERARLASFSIRVRYSDRSIAMGSLGIVRGFRCEDRSLTARHCQLNGRFGRCHGFVCAFR